MIQRVKFAQLHDTYRPLDVSHTEVVATIVEVLPPKPFSHGETGLVQGTILGASAIDSSAVRAIEGDALEHSRIIGNNHSAFSERGNIFLFVEAEASGRAHAAGLASFVFSADCVTGILDDRNVVPFGDGEDRVHVATLAIEVHGKNGFGVRGDLRFELSRIEMPNADPAFVHVLAEIVRGTLAAVAA